MNAYNTCPFEDDATAYQALEGVAVFDVHVVPPFELVQT
jgi:hypothetical protein